MFDDLSSLVALLVAVLGILIVGQGIRVVPQSMVYVVERFGKYTRTLSAGLNFIVPLLDRVQHRVSILERQLPAFKISVITRDNVEVELEATVFYRIVDAASSVYRIQNVDRAIDTAATSIVRSAAGKLDLDDLVQRLMVIRQVDRHQLGEEFEKLTGRPSHVLAAAPLD